MKHKLGVSPFASRRNDDGRDEDRDSLQFSVTFGQDTNGGEFICTEFIGEESEPPAENDDIGSGERERQFFRRGILAVVGIGIGFKSVINQLTGTETTA